jgi:hypothetical protein
MRLLTRRYEACFVHVFIAPLHEYMGQAFPEQQKLMRAPQVDLAKVQLMYFF